MSNPNPTHVSVYGNLGKDPVEKTSEEHTTTVLDVDPDTGDLAPKQITYPASNYLAYSLAVQREGMDEPVWLNCVDHEGAGSYLKKGDYVKLQGIYKKVIKDGTSYNLLIVHSVERLRAAGER